MDAAQQEEVPVPALAQRPTPDVQKNVHVVRSCRLFQDVPQHVFRNLRAAKEFGLKSLGRQDLTHRTKGQPVVLDERRQLLPQPVRQPVEHREAPEMKPSRRQSTRSGNFTEEEVPVWVLGLCDGPIVSAMGPHDHCTGREGAESRMALRKHRFPQGFAARSLLGLVQELFPTVRLNANQLGVQRLPIEL
jgi:hypothetical protein